MISSEEAYEVFQNLRTMYDNHNFTDQSEADTRCKLIDAILIDCLGWVENDIRREPHLDTGFVDYILTTDRPALVVEAKRAGDSFSLPIDVSSARNFTVGGVLGADPVMKQHFNQAIGYCSAGGIRLAIITNGAQWIAFLGSRIDGKPLAKGNAVAFRSLEDISRRFAFFHSLFSKQGVLEHYLPHFLESSQGGREYRRVVDDMHSRSDKISRNLLSHSLTPILDKYFAEIAGEDSKTLLRDLYVESEPLAQILDAVQHRISLALSTTVTGRSTISQSAQLPVLRADLREKVAKGVLPRKQGEVILLLGRVGSGKTTFVDHFLRIEMRRMFQDHLLISLDFRQYQPEENLRSFFFERARVILSRTDRFYLSAGKKFGKYLLPRFAS